MLPAMPDPTPTRIGPYTISNEIGRGGMGVVYLARDERLDRDVAVKALPHELAGDPDRMARLEREARVLAQLNHPNIAGIHGIEEQAGQKYLILEYVEGETLGERLDRGAIPVDEAMVMAIEIASGVEAAHEAGVVHRDLKPDNIKITTDGRIKVLDFGLARFDDGLSSSAASPDAPTIAAPRHSPTIPGAILGTAAYMSPEQARGRKIDKRTDIWSFGIILYEMLTGASPFAGDSTNDSIGALLHKEIDFSRLPSTTPQVVHRLLRLCLEREQRKRLRDIGDARLELEAASTNAGTSISQGAIRRGIPATVAVPAIFAALALGAVGVWFALPTTPVRPTPLRKLELAIPGLDRRADNPAVISPDGTRIVYTKGGQFWLRSLDSDRAVALEGTENASHPFWSPDGRELGFVIDQIVYRMPASGGARTLIIRSDQAFAPYSGVTWTESNRVQITNAEGRPIWECSVTAGTRNTVLEPEQGVVGDYHFIHALPGDAGSLAIEHREGGMADAIVLVRDGSAHVVVEHPGDELMGPVYDPASRHILYCRCVLDPGIWAVPFSIEQGKVTGDPFRVHDAPAIPSVSRDGLLVFAEGLIQVSGRNTRRTELVWVDRDGNVVQTIEGTLAGMNGPCVSPDGRYIVVVATEGGRFQLWVFDTKRGIWSPIHKLQTNINFTDWLHDGRIAFDDHWKSYAIAPDGSGEPQLYAEGDNATFSGDGRYIASELRAENPEDDWDVVLTDTQEGTSKTIVGGPGYQGMPRISQDGNWLLYYDDKAGSGQVYLTRLPEADQRWQVSSAGGERPQFGPNGREIFFSSAFNAGKKLMVVSFQREPEVVLGSPQQLFGSEIQGLRVDARYDIAAAGDRFLMVREINEPDQAERIMVFENWLQAR